MKSFLLFCFAALNGIIFAQNNLTFSFTYQDSVRAYKVYVPQKYLDNPTAEVPLLLNLHGLGSENWQQEVYGDFRPIADTENFIICHPNGTFNSSGQRFWNAGFASTIDDIGFLSALIDTLKLKYNINDEKVFSTGMSNGGFMSLTLACELSDKVKAVASVTGSMTINQITNCSNTSAIPVMQIHGTADPTVAYNGSLGVAGIEAVVGFWVNHNGCDSVAVITNVADVNTSDNSTATRYDFNQNCGDDAAVVFYKIENGGHTWPGGSFLLPGLVTNLDFNASVEIWKFFCPESGYVGIKTEQAKDLEVKVYPNPSNNLLTVKVGDLENILEIKIYNEVGAIVKEQNEKTVNVSRLNNGVYFMKIKTEKGFYHKRFLKE